MRIVRNGYQYYWNVGFPDIVAKTSTLPCADVSWCGSKSDERCDLTCFEGFCHSTLSCDPLVSYCNTTTEYCDIIEIPTEPPTEPIIPPQPIPPQPKQCPLPKPQPELLFECDSTKGVWVARNNSLTEQIVLSTTTEINGDLVVSENVSIVIDITPLVRPGDSSEQSPAEEESLEYLVTVIGTLTLEKPIILVISSEYVDLLGETDVGYSTYILKLINATEIVLKLDDEQGSPVHVEVDEKTRPMCEEVTTEPQFSEDNSSNQLSVIFYVDSTQCNLWWVIVIPVCSVLIIITITIAIVITRNRTLRKIVTPYKDAEL